MRTLLLRSTLAILLCTSAHAATEKAAEAPKPEFTKPSTSLKGLKAGTYVLDERHAFIIFSVDHLGFSTYYGRVNDFDGSLYFDPAFPEKAKLTITMDPASIDTNYDVMEDKLDSEEFFDVKKYPGAKFVSTKIEKLTDTTGLVTGNLTLHGVTKPVTLDVKFNGHGPMPMGPAKTVMGFSAMTTIKRSDFGIDYGVPMVSDDVIIAISAEFGMLHEQKKGE